jgi:ribonuclease P/MRP protein subunit POP1
MHGFTLLLPAGWSQYLLVAFAYAGALIAGLRERQSQSREAGVHNFPEHYGAVCDAGGKWEDDKAKEEQRRWDRKPPGKRANWEALGMRWPFKPDWAGLAQVCHPNIAFIVME